MSVRESGNEVRFKSFDALYEAALKNKAIAISKNETERLNNRSLHNFKFNDWLSKFKGLQEGNTKQYSSFLNAKTFIEYLNHDSAEASRDNERFQLKEAKLAAIWKVEVSKPASRNRARNAEAEGEIAPIQWLGTERLLGHLLQSLEVAKLINTGDKINKTIIDHFVNKQGKHFSNSIRQNRSNTGKNNGKGSGTPNKPKGAEIIERLVSILKSEEHKKGLQ